MTLVFDAVNTLIYKPELYKKIQNVLKKYNYNIELNEIKFKHILLSEIIIFPDRTNYEFYLNFNKEYLILLGIPPTSTLIEDLFNECSYLKWDKFDDTEIINQLPCNKYVISNFNTTLQNIFDNLFPNTFKELFVSEELKVRKPSNEFYQLSFKKISEIEKNEEIIYVGDSFKLDYFPVEKMNLHSILIDRNEFYNSNIRKIKSLNELKRLFE